MITFPSRRHRPARKPSTSRVQWAWLPVQVRPLTSGAMTRVRSACESRRWSNSGRKRGGAGVPGSGRGGVGQVEELRPVLVAQERQARTQPLERLAQPGQAGPGLHVLDGRGPKAAR
ncbi:hypothetical protein AMK16_05535 [Streptomyces sp. CB00455]|nr:hypothetical protein AMK16_05535 [Streptomyces sp. CB00455]